MIAINTYSFKHCYSVYAPRPHPKKWNRLSSFHRKSMLADIIYILKVTSYTHCTVHRFLRVIDKCILKRVFKLLLTCLSDTLKSLSHGVFI